MPTVNLLKEKSQDGFGILHDIVDPSCKFPFWILSPGSKMSEKEKLLSSTIDIAQTNISENGFEDFWVKLAESIWQELTAYRPKTPLGQKLWKIRERIIASGEPLLSWEAIEHELDTQRGEKR